MVSASQARSSIATEKKAQILLIAEDYSESTSLLDLLGSRYSVVHIQNEREALQRIHDDPPALLILGGTRAPVSGELFKALKSQRIHAIILSDDTSLDSMDILNDPNIEFLQPPYTQREIEILVRSQLKQASLMQQAQWQNDEQRFRLLAESLPVLITYVDQNYRYRFNNHAYSEWFKMKPEEFWGLHIQEVIGEAAFAKIKSYVDAALSGKRVKYESYIPYGQGEERYVEAVYIPDRDSEGRVQGYFAMIFDITERQKASEALRQNEIHFRQIANLLPAFVWKADANGAASFINDRWYQYTGLSKEKSLGYGAYKVIHPDDLEYCMEEMRLAKRKKKTFEASVRIRSHENEYRWFFVRAEPTFDTEENLTGWIGASTDIHDKVIAEETLREKEERLRAAIEASETGTYLWEVATGKLLCDRKMNQLFGLPLCKRLQSLKDFISHIHPDDLSAVSAALDRCLQNSEDFNLEYRTVWPDGSIHWLLDKGKMFLDEEGIPEHMSGACVDITRIKIFEQQLIELNQNLEQRVAQRTASLIRYQDQLRRLTIELSYTEQRERRRLAGDLHDYLAQLLVAARMHINRASRQLPEHPAIKILQETDQTLEQSLKYTRTLIAELSPTILYEAGFAAAVQWLAQQMEKRGLKVIVSKDSEEFPLMEEHSIILYESIRELLLNIVKHAQVNEASITMSITPANQLHICVQDYGAGFSNQQEKDITADSGKYGLFNIRERLRAIGGEFEIQSKPNEGTTSNIHIPLQIDSISKIAVKIPSTHRHPSERKKSERSADAKIRILLVDDHDMVRDGMRRVIESFEGFKVIGEAANGIEAVEKALDLRPDVTVMDLNLPGINGIEATRLIKKQMPEISILGLSVHDDSELAASMKEAGAYDYLTKDCPSDNLHHAILAGAKIAFNS